MKAVLPWSDIQYICAAHPAFADARPWLDPLTSGALDWPGADHLNLSTRRLIPDFPWEFVTQKKAPSRSKSRGSASLTGYIAQITSEGKIPLRERSLHDLLNALSFLMFPKSKMALNRRHLAESPDGVKPGQNRTRIQDLLTIFDEGGVLRMVTPEGVHKDFIFGHAVYEHIAYKKPLRAARLDLPLDPLPPRITSLNNIPLPDLTRMADEALEQWLNDPSNCRTGDEFSHLWIDA